MEIFDVHHHVGALHDASWKRTTDEKAEHHARVLERYGISGSAIMPSPTYTNPDGLEDTRAVNDEIAEMLSAYSDWFKAGFGTVEPLYGETGLGEIDRIVDELELDGVMWHNRWQSEYVDANIMYDMIERAADHETIVGLHAHCDSELTAPWRIFDVAESFPEITFLVFDAFSSKVQGKQVVSELRHRNLDNVVFDTALMIEFDRQITPSLDVLGTENVVFGSDLYSHEDEPFTANPVEQVRSADLTEDQKRRIFYENARDLFGF